MHIVLTNPASAMMNHPILYCNLPPHYKSKRPPIAAKPTIKQCLIRSTSVSTEIGKNWTLHGLGLLVNLTLLSSSDIFRRVGPLTLNTNTLTTLHLKHQKIVSKSSPWPSGTSTLNIKARLYFHCMVTFASTSNITKLHYCTTNCIWLHTWH